MEEYAFAARTDHEHYKYFYAQSLEELYSEARQYFPVRSLFEGYFLQASKEDNKYLIKVAPEAEDDYFEIILGNSRAVAQLVFMDHIKALEKKGLHLQQTNLAAVRLIENLADGKISIDGLKKLKDQFIAGQNAAVVK